MLRIRVIPILLLHGRGLVKGSKFKGHKYVGDPLNAVRIFNEKEVDELVFLDISANKQSTGPNFSLVEEIAEEAFMPFSYGGGISNLFEIERLFKLGVEKVILNSSAVQRPELITEAVESFGSQSIVVSIDVRQSLLGKYQVYIDSGRRNARMGPVELAKSVEALGAGEIILCSVDREGTRQGYDLHLVKQVASALQIPVVASGGAGALGHFSAAVNEAGAAGVAAGDMFIFHGKHKAVLITYPDSEDLSRYLSPVAK